MVCSFMTQSNTSKGSVQNFSYEDCASKIYSTRAVHFSFLYMAWVVGWNVWSLTEVLQKDWGPLRWDSTAVPSSLGVGTKMSPHYCVPFRWCLVSFVKGIYLQYHASAFPYSRHKAACSEWLPLCGRNVQYLQVSAGVEPPPPTAHCCVQELSCLIEKKKVGMSSAPHLASSPPIEKQ